MASNLLPVLNTFFVSGELGLAVAGINTIAVYIASIVEIPYRSLAAISRPHISQGMKDDNVQSVNALVKNVSLHQFIVSTFIFLIIWINIELIYDIIPNGNLYVEAKWVVLILSLVKIVNTSLNVGATVLSYSKYYYHSLLLTIILTLSAIFLNIKLIPLYGMEGSAMASLLSYILYYAILLTLVYFKLKISPFSLKHSYTILIISSLFVINWIMRMFISEIVINLFDIKMIGLILDAMIRTLIISFIGLYIIYKTKISQQINDIIDKFLSLLLRKHKI